MGGERNHALCARNQALGVGHLLSEHGQEMSINLTVGIVTCNLFMCLELGFVLLGDTMNFELLLGTHIHMRAM